MRKNARNRGIARAFSSDMRNATSSAEFRLAREGKGWVAIPPGFQDIEVSPIGYAPTQDGAIADLLASPDFARLAARKGWRVPGCVPFVVVDALEDATPKPRKQTSLRLVSSR